MNESLTPERRRELQRRLEDDYNALCANVREELLNSDQNTYAVLADKVADVGDASVADLLVDLGIAEIDRHVREIQRIEAALRRLADGSYGYCIDCGDAIVVRRLQANPAVARCYACQTRFEQEEIGGTYPPTL
ncbi:MAG: TraR/DksA family transcriptional regulator [Nitrococcus mobilis]|nr:TraR/DksA family transcriptional regulator [Nitrococcus mobilis]